MSDYAAFLAGKRRDWTGVGSAAALLPDGLYPFQERLTRWAVEGPCGALGRHRARQNAHAGRVGLHIPGRVLILAPLCVGPQTIAEAQQIGVTVGSFGEGAQIEITNYERLHHVDPASTRAWCSTSRASSRRSTARRGRA